MSLTADGATDTSHVPFGLNLKSVVHATNVAAGLNHVILLDSTGHVWSVGCGTYGQLGNGPGSDWLHSHSFRRIAALGECFAIGAGERHSVATSRLRSAAWALGRQQLRAMRQRY